MGIVICGVITLIIGYAVFSAITRAFGITGLQKNGRAAKGILLVVANTGTRTSTGLRASEIRQMVIDVEIPGEPPYEFTGLVSFPANLRSDVLPGATVELRVDPKNRNKIIIVGPGVGFSVAQLTALPVTATRTS